jgi:hypothetical protein
MRLPWLALLAGCYKPAGEQACAIRCPCPDGLTCDNGVCVDSSGGCGSAMGDAAAPDAPVLPDGQQICVQGQPGSYFRDVCLDNVQTLALSGVLDTSGACMPTTDSRLSTFCVEYGSIVSLTGVVATGMKPLVVIATDTIVIHGKLDVSSDHLGQIGAGAGTGICTAENGASETLGGGGGAGGSFGGKGGNGGDVNTAGGAVAGSVATAPPPTLMAGCLGGAGADYSGAGISGGGFSGGAVYLMAQNQIQLENGSSVLAVGAAGQGGNASGGGAGGGGSGGMIVFDTMQIVGCPPGPSGCLAIPIVVAHGGGGGGGASSVPGQPGKETTSISGASGGTGASMGGSSSSDTSVSGFSGAPVNPTMGGFGGAGGGGGDGFIRKFALSSSMVTFSPMPQ